MGTKWAKMKRYWKFFSSAAFLFLKFIDFINVAFKVFLRLLSNVHVNLYRYITLSMTNSFLNYSQWDIHIC